MDLISTLCYAKSQTKKWQNMRHLCSRISNPAAPTKNFFEAELNLEHRRTGVQQNYGNFIKYTVPLASRATLFVRLFTLCLILTF
jgi:hypothetical protein